MNENILYLTKSNILNKYGLLFPSEIDDENYYGIGNLYIPNNKLNKLYNIQAIHNDKIVNIELTLVENNIYTCNINNIGNFSLKVEKLYKPLPYIGNISQYTNKNMHYRLKLINTQKAEYYVREQDFYFIGNE